jgi:hypothetical protein
VNSVSDDELGALLAQDLRRRTTEIPKVDLDAIVSARHRTVFRRNAIASLATTGILATTAWLALPTLTGQGSAVHVAPATIASPNPIASPSPRPETEAATASRLTKALRGLLREHSIPVLGKQPVMLPRLYNNPAGTFQGDLKIDKGTAELSGRGLFVNVQRASVPAAQRIKIECATDDPVFAAMPCRVETLSNGTTLEIHSPYLRKGHLTGASVAARQPDGDLVAVAVTGAVDHWPTGVSLDALKQIASSPLLNP